MWKSLVFHIMTAGRYKYKEILLNKILVFEENAGYELVVKAKPSSIFSGILYRWYLINPYDILAELVIDGEQYQYTKMLHLKYSKNAKTPVACFLMNKGKAQIRIKSSALNSTSFNFTFAVQRIST